VNGTDHDTDVLIVGAGPVGLTLAIDLASRGVNVRVVELRRAGEPPSVKCNHVSARSMEIFRRLGIAGTIRAAGLPADYPHDVSYRTTTVGEEMSRIRIPSPAGRARGEKGDDTWWPTPEPPHRINQIFLEPILFQYAVEQPRLKIMSRTSLEGFEEVEGGVSAKIRDLETGAVSTISCRYLIGCDGGSSGVRKAIGAKLVGDAVVQRVQSSFIDAPALLGMMTAAPAWSNFSLNPRRSGNVYAIDGERRWLVHNYLKADEPEFDSVDRDWSIRQILGVGPDFQYEMITNEDWVGRRLVADRFRRGRVFLCGDAAHIWVPFAGYGMNAGIADAANLAWLLAAHLRGWAPATILDAYEGERGPITEQVSYFAMNHAQQAAEQRRSVPDDLEALTPEGEAARRALGQAAYDLNVRQYCCGGLNFGYFYETSPLIAYDGAAAPGYSMSDFTPSTVPGCRTPHFWLEDGRSLYDAMGPDYTLLRFDRSIAVTGLVEAARRKGVPLTVLDVGRSGVPPVYEHALLLSRPDQHVAWRGDRAPEDPTALIDRIRGAASGAVVDAPARAPSLTAS